MDLVSSYLPLPGAPVTADHHVPTCQCMECPSVGQGSSRNNASMQWLATNIKTEAHSMGAGVCAALLAANYGRCCLIKGTTETVCKCDATSTKPQPRQAFMPSPFAVQRKASITLPVWDACRHAMTSCYEQWRNARTRRGIPSPNTWGAAPHAEFAK